MESMASGTWPAVRQWGILWMMPLKKSMQQSMTGSVWSCLRTRRSLPPVSDMDDLDTIEGDVTRNICVNIRLFDGWDE